MLKIEYVDIKNIKPYENNAKKHPSKQTGFTRTAIEDWLDIRLKK